MSLLLLCLLATDPEPSERVWLRHSFATGDVIQYEVANTETLEMLKGESAQTIENRTRSMKRYVVTEVDAEGVATLELTIDDVRMSAAEADGNTIEFDSRTDDPSELPSVARTLGRPMARIRLRPSGEIVAVEDLLSVGASSDQFERSNQHTLVQFPDEPIGVGERWKQPFSMRVQPDPQMPATVAIRLQRRYRIAAIETGVATIEWAVVPLTPIDDPEVEAQIAHVLLSGTLSVAIESGRVRSRSGGADQTIVGFAGPSTLMRKSVTVSETIHDGRPALK